MEFSIDFNHHTLNGDKILEQLGATPKYNNDKEFLGYFIKLNDFTELKELNIKLNKLKNDMYYLVIDIADDYPAIYFDNKV